MRATVHDDGRVGVEGETGVWFFRDVDGTAYRVLPGPYGGRRRMAQDSFAAAVLRAIDNYEPRETGDAWTGGFAKNH